MARHKRPLERTTRKLLTGLFHSDILKTILKLPNTTKIEFKEHQESIQQRVTIEESRREKAANQHRKPQNQRQHQGNNDSAQGS